MRNSAAVAVLSRPGRLERRLAELREWRTARGSSKVTARYGGTESRQNYRYRDDNTKASLSDLDSRIETCRRELAAARRAADALLEEISAMPDPTAERDALLLRLRFLYGHSWERVQQGLGGRGYPVPGQQTLYSWTQTALRRANAVIRDAPSQQNHPLP